MANTPNFGGFIKEIRLFLADRFNLDEDKENELKTIEEIKKGVVFKGTNLWILIFAIMVASVGLNVNSTAVIIGAMLISPLMGPIMGIGLGVGINDFQLIMKALKNLGIAAVISVIASGIYFFISPLHEAQSELLARTNPSLYDVMIAFFGGLAGIVAGSRKEKSNAIPGVAIATALMPPLCTAGFGLATLQWNYFFGALYLFFINSVFISLSTFLIVRFLRFPRKEFMDQKTENQVRRYITLFILITIIPSIVTAVNLVRKSVFQENANQFINKELAFNNCQVISRKLDYESDPKLIEVSLFGDPVPPEMLDMAKSKMKDYNLGEVEFKVRQGYQKDNGVDLATVEKMSEQMKSGIIEELYKKSDEMLQDKEWQISILQDEIVRLRSKQLPIEEIVTELKAINSNVEELSISHTLLSNVDSLTQDTVHLAYLNFKRRPRNSELTQVQDWLKARIQSENIRFVID